MADVAAQSAAPAGVSHDPSLLLPTDVLVNAMVNLEVLIAQHSGIDLIPPQTLFTRRVILDMVEEGMEAITGLWSRQLGKALDVATPILTRRGWVTMGDVVPGDFVYAPDGTATRVKATSPVFHDHACFEVEFADGQKIVADAAHRWEVVDRASGAKRRISEPHARVVLTTQQMYEGRKKTSARYQHRYAVDVPKPVVPPPADLPLNPYVLGVWLGDGTTARGEITSADPAILRAVTGEGYQRTYTYAKAGCRTVGFPGLGQDLRALGLLDNKHVPRVFMEGSITQRLALLQGLMDTDGCAPTPGGTGSTVEFCSTLRGLAEQVLFLARSLGWKAVLKEERARLYGKDCGSKYRVTFSAFSDDDMKPFRLRRKLRRLRPRSRVPFRLLRERANAVVAIRPVATRPTKCLSVEHESHLFLAGTGLVPTHNSEAISCMCLSVMLLLPALSRAFPDDPRLKKFRRGVRIGVFAPIDDLANIIFSRVVERLFAEGMQAILLSPDINVEVLKCSGGKLVLSNGSALRARTASSGSHLEGWTYHLLVSDESQDLDKEKVAKSISPMGARTGATWAKIGTPENRQSDFYEAIVHNIAEDRKLPPDQESQSRRLHYEFDWTVGEKFDPTGRYGKYVRKEMARYGENSLTFRLKFKLEWHFDIDMAFPDDVLRKMQDTRRPLLMSWTRSPTVAGWDVAQVKDGSIVWACAMDLARPAMVYSVAPEKRGGARPDEHQDVVCYHKALVGCLEMHGVDWDSQYRRVADFCRRMNVKRLLIDVNGAGSTIPSTMQLYLPDVEVIGVNWASTVQKSICNTFYLQETHAGRVTVPWSDVAKQSPVMLRWMEEHKNLAKRYAGNYLVLEKPDDEHADDHCDASVLAVWGTKDPLEAKEPAVLRTDVFSRVAGGAMLAPAGGAGAARSRSDKYRSRRR